MQPLLAFECCIHDSGYFTLVVQSSRTLALRYKLGVDILKSDLPCLCLQLVLASITGYLALSNSGAFMVAFNTVSFVTICTALLPLFWWTVFEDTAEKRMRYELLMARARQGNCCSRLVYHALRARHGYTALFGLRGKYYYQRQHFVELLETGVQFYALLESARTADV